MFCSSCDCCFRTDLSFGDVHGMLFPSCIDVFDMDVSFCDVHGMSSLHVFVCVNI